MKIKKCFLASLLLGLACSIVSAQSQPFPDSLSEKIDGSSVFRVINPDYRMSPFTGLTRRHWKDAALYLLKGAFTYVHTIDDPMQFPKEPGKSYPRTPSQVPTEKLEGLCRTLFMAAPLLREDSNLIINNIRVVDYYRRQLGNLVDSTKASYIRRRASNGGPSQTLVEFGGLAVSLFVIPNLIWEPLPEKQKNMLAATMLSYGDGPTIGNNWKFFNIFILSFFKDKGYRINEKLLVEYLDKSLAHYRKDGWYSDAPAFDYYSMWAFQMYGPLWSQFFGKKYYPEYAMKFMANAFDVRGSYPYLFGRGGEMIMWGRSMSYRFASVIPFPLMGLQNDASTNYGWMRRIASGVMLQFLRNPSFLEDGVPTLGFYGSFEPAVQPYSCRGSVFWMSKAFLGLLVPEDSPFWTATENEGPWEKEMKKDQVYNHYLDSSHILITDYPGIGASEIRAWCNARAINAGEPFRSSENYNRLSYNSAFPWQADSADGVVAMNYIIRNKRDKWEPLRLYTFRKFAEGAYYRDAVLETNPGIRFNLCDLPLANGILRVDRIAADTAFDLRLGHYALPKLRGKIKESTRKGQGQVARIIDNGQYQLAMISLKGWEGMNVREATGVHPASAESKVLNVSSRFDAGKTPSAFYVTVMLWKRSGEKWKTDELFCVKAISESPQKDGVTVVFADGTEKVIRFQ